MIVYKGMGGPMLDVTSNAYDYWLNKIWYGLPSNIPVPVPGAPQTQADMTSGTYTPSDSVSSMWDKYKQDSTDFFNQIPANAGQGSNLVWIGLGIGALVLFYLWSKK